MIIDSAKTTIFSAKTWLSAFNTATMNFFLPMILTLLIISRTFVSI